MSDYFFLYYRRADSITLDELENGCYWRKVPELPEPFFSQEEALAWLKVLVGDDEMSPAPGYGGEKQWHFPWLHYTARTMGVMYLGPMVDVNNPWYVGGLRGDEPRPQGMCPGQPSKIIRIMGKYTETCR